MAALLRPELFTRSSKCQLCSTENSPRTAKRGGGAGPCRGGGTQAAQPCLLTDSCEEEPRLVDWGVPLLLIVVDGDLGGKGVHWEGEKSRDHRSQAGKSAVMTFPASHLTGCKANFLQTTELSPTGSTPGLEGCFPQIIDLDRVLLSSRSASMVLSAWLFPLMYAAACGAPHICQGVYLVPTKQ